MDMKAVESKWQQRWEKTKENCFNKKNIDKKYYVLEMFSYPSGAKLHIGHWYNYGPSDSFARFKKMQGYEVFQPMGFDAFGLPAENYAIKTKIHPKDSTEKNIETMEHQLKAMGAMFDWSAEVKTCEENYYKWTQWMFLKLYENGLAYRKEAPVNWCPSCNTVLANEQVVEGCCERCGTPVIKRDLTQWFFKITQYAEELLQGLNTIDWPEKTKLMQRNWIGKSVGCEIEFACESGDTFRVFTTRCDTIFGVSYVVLAPEHPLVKKLVSDEQRPAVEAYIEQTAKTNEIDRLSSSREKTGVFIGHYAVNPINGEKIPIYAADYVLYSYGTGAVMGAPAHDERDFAFAQKYGLPVKKVIENRNGETVLPFCEDGICVNSLQFDGRFGEEARTEIANYLSKIGKGERKVNYRLRDWLVSRQRYWGAPIPVVHCPHCGIVPVPYKDLPVKLPYNVEFKPDGKSPLAKCDEFMHTKCPKCGVDTEIVDKMLPVDKYIGGAEHACMHLLYARFFTKALRDMGYLHFDEPFKSLVHQGVILGPDGNRMSKSKGNIVSPDEYVSTYGSDVFRMYLMFGFSYTEGGPWSDDGIKSVAKFLDRVERFVLKAAELPDAEAKPLGAAEKELNYARNYAVKQITRDVENFSFNTAVARLMEYVNALYKYDGQAQKDEGFLKESTRDLLLLIAPFAPHFAEELWERFGGKYSVFDQRYPVCDESALVREETEYAVQVNSKIKAKMMISKNSSQEEIREAVLADDAIRPLVEGKVIRKFIVVPGRLVNIIV